MPFYEYKCLICDHKFEILSNGKDKLIPQCRHCGENKVERLISATSFQLKGKGWYKSDYAAKTKGEKKVDDKNEGADKSAEKKEKSCTKKSCKDCKCQKSVKD